MKTVLKNHIHILLAVIILGFGGVSSHAGTDTNKTPPRLRVVIVPSKNEVRVKEQFKVGLRVENPTATNQIVRVWGCSWDEEWKSSNTNISWVGWDCGKNNTYDLTIPPGGAYTNELEMLIPQPISDHSPTFQMGFTPIGSETTFWSDGVKLNILPPDTWVQRGKYYRDRNHDGKIDWEVSGMTFMGHAVFPFKSSTNSAGSLVVTEEFTGQGVDTFKVDTNYDGFYDLEYGAGGTSGQIQWTKSIHERVPMVGKDFVPIVKETWMDYWMPK